MKHLKLMAIGEALIDFLPDESGTGIENVGAFLPAVGGAPTNVCGAFSKLGGESAMITQLGVDSFGDKILKEFQKYRIGCDYVRRTDKANTSLAFVALNEDGNREFSFYRNPGADMLYRPEDIRREWFQDGYALHFCSVSLGDFPMKEAHKKAIEYAREAGMIISFDPNLRPALWKSEEEMIEAVRAFLPLADIVKVSDEELLQITGCDEIEKGLTVLFQGEVKVVIYTEGAKGASVYTRREYAKSSTIHVNVVDTTGAGDGFIGSFLYRLYEEKIRVSELEELSKKQLQEYIEFSNKFCSISVQKKGAIVSYPDKQQIK